MIRLRMADGRQRLDPFLVALGRADLWAVALAGFLVRGGLLLFLVPIVWLPSPLDLADLLGSAVTAAALGGPNPDLVRLVVLGALAATIALVVAFWLGAVMDVAVASIGRLELGVPRSYAPSLPTEPPRAPGRAGRTARAFAVRLAALLPFAVAVALTAPAVVDATYHELINPSTLAVPLVVRVLGEVPGVVVLVVACWLVGEAVGGIAVRYAVLDGRSAASALVAAGASVVRRPIAAVAALLTGTIVMVALVAPALVASALVWRSVLFAFRAGAPPLVGVAEVVVLAALWLGGLVLAGFAASVRALIWTVFAEGR